MVNRGLHTIPQDNVKGWLAVFAAFLAHVITHGILYSFGVLFITLQDNYSGSKADIAWIGSLATGAVYLIGPVAGSLTSRFGCVFVTSLGATIGAVGYILSIFAPNLYVLYLTMGLLAGSGFGMVFLTAIVTVTLCFTKYRSIACGIALSGAGSGAFIFSPFIKWLLDTYSLRGSLLILGAIILNCIPCGLLFKISIGNKKSASRTKTKSCIGKDDGKPLENGYTKHSYSTTDDTLGVADVPDDVHEELQDHRCIHIRECNFQEDDVGESLLDISDTLNRKSETVKTERNRKSSFFSHFHIFKSNVFVLFAISQFLFFFGLYLPFVYIPDRASLIGIDEHQAVWIVSTIGLSSIFSRIVFGYIADRPNISRLRMFKVAFLCTGLTTCVSPLLSSPPTLFTYAVCFGMATGITLSLTSVVLVDLLGMARLTDAFGMNNFLTGIACFLGPPFAGFLFDATRNYDASFLAAGISMTMGALLMFLTPLVTQDKKETNHVIYVTSGDK